MHAHDRYQSSIMHLHARDSVIHQHLTPFSMRPFAIWKQAELGFELHRPNIRLGRRQSESVSIYGTGAGVPELRNILSGIAEISAISGQFV
jgi:hypothetical protein